ncbi:family 16 glycoside hydrolase [Neorhodopirellula lusitana]|uniref:family 16 glycoside hydrolase n=1 Tax=Neorhodopirellula lusitana TaxID=445327 RepID=UPI00384FF1EA
MPPVSCILASALSENRHMQSYFKSGFHIVSAAFLGFLVCPVSGRCQEALTKAPVMAVGTTATEGLSGKSEPVSAFKLTHQFQPVVSLWESASFGGDGVVEFKEMDSSETRQAGKAEEPATPLAESGDSGRAEPHLLAAAKGPKQANLLIELGMGHPMTGVRWTGEMPRENYEIKLQARRVDGFDFFVAVTFPVGKEYCSFVLGGWGGGTVGLSSIDGNDAANNETSQYKEFEQGTWYDVRVRVDEKKIQCWIDDEEWVSVEREPHEFEVRIEMDPCLPLGLANFQCQSEVRSIQMRTLSK